MENQRPFLAECTETLKRLSHEAIRKSPKATAELYLASVGLLCLLKADKATLKLHEGKDKVPSPNEIPAITAVIQDPRLFCSLLNCLKAPLADVADDATRGGRPLAGAGSVARGRGALLVAGRKRTMSYDDGSTNGANKAMKLTHSPMPPAQSKSRTTGNQNMTPMASNTTGSSTPGMSKQDKGMNKSLELPLQVVVATIFTSALQHLDNWPAPLLQAYAEDAFGPRLWVDDERCSCLVENLKLCHVQEQVYSDQDEQAWVDAAKVAAFYEQVMENVPPISPMPDRPGLEHQGSSSSLLQGSARRIRAASIDGVNVPMRDLDDDSDSGEEEVVEESSTLVVNQTPKPSVVRPASSGNDSSSGEEEIEEDGIVTSASSQADGANKSPMATSTLPYPVSPKTVDLMRVRPRYVGINQMHAWQGITVALSERLDQRSKQNSRLLQALPSFVAVPGVRSLSAQHLGKWLQSPALSGPARLLFTSTVSMLKNADPPLKEDLAAIDAILSMQLKANQRGIHIENVTNIAKRIPTAAVARHIFLKLMKDEVVHLETDPNQSMQSEHLQMIGAVYGALPASFSSDGLAAAILSLLAERNEREIRKLRLVIRRIAVALGEAFDGCQLLESLLSFDVGVASWTAEDEENKGRVLLECVCLLVPVPEVPKEPVVRGKQARRQPKQSVEELSKDEIVALKKKLVKARKFLISWCCNEYAPLLPSKKTKIIKAKKGATIAGAGPPDYSSILHSQEEISEESSCPDVIKCMLFMLEPESPAMQEFLHPSGSPDVLDRDEVYRLRLCHAHGSDVDDEMIWIVLHASSLADNAGMSSSLALSMIEHLFECCREGQRATLNVSDSRLAWELYKLVEYTPTVQSIAEVVSETDTDESDVAMQDSEKTNKPESDLPRLAYPGRWWRVTTLLLIMSGSAPATVGKTLCLEHPTIAALIRMVTSGRYRFPTLECDDEKREEMKKAEASLRDEESRVAERLFLPPPPKKKKKKRDEPLHKKGSRVSARQQQKQERIWQQQREQEAAEALLLAAERKRMLKSAQKSIMIGSPKSPARKPPKESINLLLSAQEMFGLSRIFQETTDPDFVLQAIGSTTRGAIERASIWLVPVISSLPSIIDRLPASSSCYLLLWAYSGEGEGKSEMRALSAPLLDHVRRAVTGEFGQDDSARAVNLLFAEVADKRPDRRRCARRVFQDALSQVNAEVTDESFRAGDHTWLLGLLLVQHSQAFVSDAIGYISQALVYESGSVLRALVLALERYISFASENNIQSKWSFSSVLCDLIARRHAVCSQAMDRFDDLRATAVAVVHGEFKRHIEKVSNGHGDTGTDLVQLKPCRSCSESKQDKVVLPLHVLESTCVLLCIWKESESGGDRDASSKESIHELANFLMHPTDSSLVDAGREEGIASATIVGSGVAAVSVEQWVMLAKSRTDYIARRAALSAPVSFLPRLLLCSGLPRSSLLTMVDRLGKRGDQAEDRDKVFRELLTPSAMSDWGMVQLGSRREVARRLIGRLSSYSRLENHLFRGQDISLTFLHWLTDECSSQDKAKKPRQKRSKSPSQGPLATVEAAGLLLSNMSGVVIEDEHSMPDVDMAMESLVGAATTAHVETSQETLDKESLRVTLEKWCQRQEYGKLESLAHATLQSAAYLDLRKESHVETIDCETLLRAILELNKLNSSYDYQKAVAKWLPALVDEVDDDPRIWQSLFSTKWNKQVADELVSQCASCLSDEKVLACHSWILEQGAKHESECSIQCMVRFLVVTSGMASPYMKSFDASLSSQATNHVARKVKEGASLAIKCAAIDCSGSAKALETSGRNNLPDWMLLVMQLAQGGRQPMSLVVEVLLQAISADSGAASGFGVALKTAALRLYTKFPMWMSTANPTLRSALVSASKSTPSWLNWRCPWDARIHGVLWTLMTSQSQRLVQSLLDLAKNHPLLLLRQLNTMRMVLERDASSDSGARNANNRSRVYGESLTGPLEACWKGQTCKLSLRHWGYGYTDPLWVTVIDVLLAVHEEVLFSCGLEMGLFGLLGTYVELFIVQASLNNRGRGRRLHGRFLDLLKVFEKHPVEWNEWLVSKKDGTQGNVRNLLVTSNLLTTEQARENIRSNQEQQQAGA